MSNTAALALALMSGLLLGMFFFGGLWWTIRRALPSPAPALWFLASGLIRSAVAIEGFYAVSHGDWRRLLACLLGFFMARTAVLQLSAKRAAASDHKAPA